LPGAALPDTHDGSKLIDLFRSPNVWVKLSAPYRVGSDALATTPPAEWLRAILRVAPDRCVWGSDWPHTPPHTDQNNPTVTPPYRAISYERLLADFLDALPDANAAKMVMSDNPARLYGFTPA